MVGVKAFVVVEAIIVGDNSPVSGFRSLTRSAYRNVFNVCSQFPILGDIQAIITLRQFLPTKLCFNTCVNLLPRNGTCVNESPVANARMTSFNANRDVLISAPSNRVARLAVDVSAPRSLPAKSIKVNRLNSSFPFRLVLLLIVVVVVPRRRLMVVALRYKCNCNTAWERLLSAFRDVVPVDRNVAPSTIKFISSFALWTG